MGFLPYLHGSDNAPRQEQFDDVPDVIGADLHLGPVDSQDSLDLRRLHRAGHRPDHGGAVTKTNPAVKLPVHTGQIISLLCFFRKVQLSTQSLPACASEIREPV